MNNSGFASVHVDVTEVNEFEANMEHARRQAEAISQAKTIDLDLVRPKDGSVGQIWLALPHPSTPLLSKYEVLLLDT